MATRQNIVNPQAHVQVDTKHDASANAAAVITIAADAENFWAISRIDWSYSGTPTGRKLTVEFGSTKLLDIDIRSSGHGYYDLKFPDLLHNSFTKNEDAVITLAAGASGVIGKLTVRYI